MSVGRDEFLKGLPRLLKSLPKPTVIKSEDFEKLKFEKEEYKREFDKADEENQKLRKKIDELKKAKDKAQVAAIERKYSSEWETFDDLVEKASGELERFSPVVVEAFYQRFRGGDFRPTSDNWGDAPMEAVEEGFLDFDEDQGIFSINDNNPKIQKALAALRELQTFVEEGGASERFSKQYEQKFEENFDMRLRPFWQRHLIP